MCSGKDLQHPRAGMGERGRGREQRRQHHLQWGGGLKLNAQLCSSYAPPGPTTRPAQAHTPTTLLCFACTPAPHREPIKHFLTFFIDAVDEWGPLGYLAYAAVYTGLEVLAVPAIPLTMTAGVIFGPLAGTAVVSLSGTLAATIAFLIARYAARDKVGMQPE